MIFALWDTTVTGLHDMDEFVQSQLILAVSFYFCVSASNFGRHLLSLTIYITWGWSSNLGLGVAAMFNKHLSLPEFWRAPHLLFTFLGDKVQFTLLLSSSVWLVMVTYVLYLIYVPPSIRHWQSWLMYSKLVENLLRRSFGVKIQVSCTAR